MSTTVATKNVAAGVALVVAIIASFTFAVTAKADAVSDLQAQVQALLAQISSMQSSSSTMTTCTTFTQNLTVGSKGSQVMAVQQFLNKHGTLVSATGAGSPGNETSTFGPATKSAVMRFQQKNSISPISGYWGPISRASANSMCTSTTVPPGGTTGGTTTGGTTSGGSIGVALSSVQPQGSIIAGQASAVLANLTFTGSGSVKTLKLQRTGISTDSSVLNVYLYQGNIRISDSASVVNGVITFNSTNGLFNVSGSTDVSVRADIDPAASSGNTIGVNVWSVTALGGSEMMVNNVVGMQRVVTTLSNPATINVTSAPTPSTVSINAGTTGYTLWSAPFNIGTRAVNLKAITFKYTGSATNDAISNIGLYIDGVKQPGSPMWSNTSGTARIGFDMTNSPVTLTTGSHTIELRADVVGGSFRNFTVAIENKGDIVAEDSQITGFNVGASYLGSTSFANVSAGTISINQGTLTITLDPAFGSVTKVVGGASNVAIASFKFQAYGEDVKVDNLLITPVLTGTSPSANGIRNLSVYANGGQIGSSISTATSGVASSFNLGSSLIIPAGSSTIIQVKADLMDASNNNYISGSIRADLAPATSNNYRGLTSSQYASTGALTSNNKTISSANVAFGVTSGFTAKTVSPNTPAVKIGSFTLQTGSAEGVTVTNIKVDLGLSSTTNSNFSNLTVTDALNPVGQPTSSNNFSVNYQVPANGSKQIDVYADLSTATNASITPTVTVTTRGLNSNVSSSTIATAGSVITLNAGTLALVSLDSSAPIAQYVVGGVTGVNIGPFKATASGSDIVIKRVKFNVTGSNGISAITVGGVTKSVVGSTVDVDGLNIPVALGATGALIPVSVNFAGVNSQTGNSNTNIGLTTSEVEYTAGSATIIATPSASTATHKLVGTKPVVTVGSSPSTGSLTNGFIQIGTVTITADAAGSVRATTTTFAVSVSGGAAITASTSQLKDNGNVVTQFTCSNGAITTSGNITCTAPALGYDIPAGTSKTFQLFATVTGSLGNAGTSAVTTQVLGGSNFQWYDLQGGTGVGTPLDGSLIYNFPTNTYSVRN
jgi:hypothetical protein